MHRYSMGLDIYIVDLHVNLHPQPNFMCDSCEGPDETGICPCLSDLWLVSISGLKIALNHSHLRMPQAAGHVKILILSENYFIPI